MSKHFKPFLLIAALILFLSTVVPHTANANYTIDLGLQDTREIFLDDQGNKTELEYILNENEFRVNTYVNGQMTDYSVRKKEGNEYSATVTNYILDTDLRTLKSSEYDEENVKEVRTYNVDALLKGLESVQEELNPDDMSINSIPGGLTWVRSHYHEGFKLTGHLYRGITTDRIQYYAFDFLADTALSAIASVISIYMNVITVLVSEVVGSLVLGFSNGRITEPLSGEYQADRSIYNYLVQVNNHNVHYHTHEITSVIFYNSRNGEELRKNKYSNTHLPEQDILNQGIRKATGIYNFQQ